jgi:uncharacterized SAM-binding protein YcdF (DUF218 family)
MERFGKINRGKKRLAILTVAIVSIGATLSWVFREQLLCQAGEFLIFKQKPEKSDLIVVLRGGTNFERLLTAFELYKSGYGDRIYISKSLGDDAPSAFSKFGIHIPSGREVIRYVLRELSVPSEDIILDQQSAGGGTRGEGIRVRTVASELNVRRIIVVTSWYHTRRTRLIYSEVFSGTDIRTIVVAAKKEYSKSSPSNWWKYRHQVVCVLQEFPKLCLAYLGVYPKLHFSDDPT